MQDTRNSQIRIAAPDRAGRPSAVQIGGYGMLGWDGLQPRNVTLT
jgi:hypothetical protein